MVSIGDKVRITKLNEEVLEAPQVAVVKNVGESWFDIEGEINGEVTVLKDDSMDVWHRVEEVTDEKSNIPEVGDKVIITKLSGVELESPQIATVKGVSETLFEIEGEINGCSLVFTDDYTDVWRKLYSHKDLVKAVSTPKEGQLVKVVCGGLSEFGEVVETDVSDAGEYEFKVKSGESSKTYKLNQVDSVETYKGDEDKIMPNYIELASQGMTFSEFAGEKITEKSLNFRPYDDKVNHPNHYNKYSREVIESIKGLCTPDEFRGYLKGNIIKYSARYSDKDGVQDIDKLAKYTQFLKEFELEQIEFNEVE